MKGLYTSEIQHITKVVNNVICSFIGSISNDKKESLINTINYFSTINPSVYFNISNIDNVMNDIYSNTENTSLLLHMHNKIFANLPVGNNDFDVRLNNQFINALVIYSENLISGNSDLLVKTNKYFQAFNGYYVDSKQVVNLCMVYPLIKTVILISLYTDVQKILMYINALTKHE